MRRYLLTHDPRRLPSGPPVSDYYAGALIGDRMTNISAGDTVPVLHDIAGSLHLSPFRWGMMVSHRQVRSVRAQSIHRTPRLADLRCLLPASGWYEWDVETGTVWLIQQRETRGLLLIPGIWSYWMSPSGPVRAAAALTGRPSPAFARVTDRQPITLTEQQGLQWLRQPSLEMLLVPERGRFEATPILDNLGDRPRQHTRSGRMEIW